MKIYEKNNNYTLYEGKMQDVLSQLEPNSIDSIVTDPPYELNFMGKGWDNSGVAFQKDTWKHCYDVLKPGGYLIAFGGSRTFHRIACAIEDAGFEIRDTIMWLYGSGFPKSMNIGLAIDKKNGVDNRTGNIVKGVGSNNTSAMKNGLGESQEFDSEYEERIATNEWAGWGTCLKPAYEPIIIARKPFKGSLIDNVIENGVGGLNIDECRVEFENTPNPATNPLYRKQANYKLPKKGQQSNGAVSFSSSKNDVNELGRFPANVILTYDETDFEEVCGGMPNEKGNSASRYFYCAKASKKDRDEGLDGFQEKKIYGDDMKWGYGNNNGDNFGDRVANVSRKNIHPCVKPTELMQYIIRLVTPKNGTVLDPFMGSGSTGKAAMYENKNYYFIGVEMTQEYLPIAKARIDYAINNKEITLF